MRFYIRHILFILLTGILSNSNTALGQLNPDMPLVDAVYNPKIKTVLLNPGLNQKDAMVAPIIPLNNGSLYLSFDYLDNIQENFYLKVVHCNYDWKESGINASLYMAEVNDISFQNTQNSYNTRVFYYHYSMKVPAVSMSGNYAVQVYNPDNQEVVLVKRFMVFEDKVRIEAQVKTAFGVSDRATGQQSDFTIFTAGAGLINPSARLQPVIRQNFQWYNCIYGLTPSIPRENEGVFEYNFFNGESTVGGINEFRFFDLRSLRVIGMNVDRVEQTNDRNDAYLLLDRPRNGQTYSTIQDIDGCFVPENYETKGYTNEPDYVNVTFYLEMPEQTSGRIFIYGALSDWQLYEQMEMKYDKELKLYRCTVLLKQGYYNYCYTYLADGATKHDIGQIEGNHFSTQNFYDYLVYYRPPGRNHDLLIGYKSINYMSR